MYLVLYTCTTDFRLCVVAHMKRKNVYIALPYCKLLVSGANVDRIIVYGNNIIDTLLCPLYRNETKLKLQKGNYAVQLKMVGKKHKPDGLCKC